MQMIMEKIDSGEEVGGAGGAYSYSALKRLDQIWSSLRDQQSGMLHVVKTLCASIYFLFIPYIGSIKMLRVSWFDYYWSSFIFVTCWALDTRLGN